MSAESPTAPVNAGVPASLQFIGTATTLLRLGPFTLLTDPNFLHRGQRAYLGYGLSSRRLTEPALHIDDLPALDAVLLSHLHGDHWDRAAHHGLDHQLPVFTTPSAAKTLRRRGFAAATGLPTWATHRLTHGDAELTVSAMQGQHAPGLARRLLPAVMGTMLELRVHRQLRLRLYITGDTLLTEGVHEVAERYPNLDAAVLHLGGTRLPGGLMVTMDDRQGVEMLELLDATTAIPVHHSDYGVFKSPLSDFSVRVQQRGLSGKVTYVEPGETVLLPTV